MSFCGVVETNQHSSEVTFLRCKKPSFQVSARDRATQEMLQKKKVDFQMGGRTEDGYVTVSVNPRIAFTIPAQDCAKGIVRSRHHFRPKPHQTALLKRFYPNETEAKVPPGPFLVYWAMGSGKTKGVLNCFRYCTYPQPVKVVVVCPKSVVPSWCREIASLSFLEGQDQDRFLIFHILCETQLRAVLARDPNYLRGKIVVYDEVQTLRNLTPEGYRLVSALQGAFAKILLTGTPIVNSPSEVDYLLQIPGKATATATATAKAKTNANNSQDLGDVFAGRVHHYDPHNSSELNSLKPVEVPMTWYQTFRYFECSSSLLKFGEYTIQSSTRNSYDIKQKLASIYVDDDNCPKLDAVVKEVEKYEYPQVVHSRFIQIGLAKIKAKLASSLPNAHTVRIEVFDGSVSNKERARIVQRFNSQKIDILLLSNAGQLGINLHWCQAFHNLEPFENEAMRMQTISRCLRMDSYLGDPPRPKMVPRLTEITYVSTFPAIATLGGPQLVELTKKLSDAFLVKLFPQENERRVAVKEFLTSHIQRDRYTVDEKVYDRVDQKQQAINGLLSELQQLGADPYLQELLQKQEARKRYKEGLKQAPKEGTSDSKGGKQSASKASSKAVSKASAKASTKATSKATPKDKQQPASKATPKTTSKATHKDKQPAFNNALKDKQPASENTSKRMLAPLRPKELNSQRTLHHLRLVD